MNRVKLLLSECGITFWKELIRSGAANTISVWLGNRRGAKEISETTLNYFIRDTQSFCRWLHKHGGVPSVALQELEPVENHHSDAIEPSSWRAASTTWVQKGVPLRCGDLFA